MNNPYARGLAPAHPLDLDLDLARVLARDLNRDRDLALDLDLGPVVGLARACDCTRDLVLALSDARARFHALARVYDSNLARGLDLACDLARDLARDLIHADASACDLARARVLAHNLADARYSLDRLIVALERENADAAEAVDGQSASRGCRPSQAVLRLALLTTSLLPTAHRARYREEFEADLRELAEVCRRAQWRYALGTLTNAWTLRAALRRAQRTPAPRRWWG